MSRNTHPDEATMKKIYKELQQNNIDVSQLAEFKNDRCPPSVEEGGSG